MSVCACLCLCVRLIKLCNIVSNYDALKTGKNQSANGRIEVHPTRPQVSAFVPDCRGPHWNCTINETCD